MSYKREKYIQKKSHLAIPSNGFKKSSIVNMGKNSYEDTDNVFKDVSPAVFGASMLVYCAGISGTISGLLPDTRSLDLVGVCLSFMVIYSLILYCISKTKYAPMLLTDLPKGQR